MWQDCTKLTSPCCSLIRYLAEGCSSLRHHLPPSFKFARLISRGDTQYQDSHPSIISTNLTSRQCCGHPPPAFSVSPDGTDTRRPGPDPMPKLTESRSPQVGGTDSMTIISPVRISYILIRCSIVLLDGALSYLFSLSRVPHQIQEALACCRYLVLPSPTLEKSIVVGPRGRHDSTRTGKPWDPRSSSRLRAFDGGVRHPPPRR